MNLLKEVLIVEDDEKIANYLERTLAARGYVITGKVKTGEEAIVMVATHNPDMVLMNLSISGKLSGIQSAYYITHLFDVPIIFITGLTDDTIIQQAIATEPYGLIIRPFNSASITANVAISITNHRIKRQLQGVDDQTIRKMMSVLDAMIITDFNGRIILLNPYAERLIDVTNEQVILQPINKFMILVDTRTGRRIEDIVGKIIRESLVIGHESNVAIVSIMGKKREIALKAQPILDRRKDLIGVIVRIREKLQSEKKVKR